MARLNPRILSSNSSQVKAIGRNIRLDDQPSTPSSSTESFGSDKENHSQQARRSQLGKRKSGNTSMSSPPAGNGRSSSKRRRTEGRQQVPSSQSARRRELKEKGDTSFYDPDQDEDTKRNTKRKLRDLASRVNDSRAEYLQRDSRGIQDALTEADEIYKDVKQTSVATIDSRLLVNVGDLAYKKVNTLALGDSSTGVDVDDFISKCISFMKRGDSQTQDITNTQRRRRQRQQHGNEDDEDEALDLNWGHLGRNACFLYNSRPCLSGFLLGPLSVQKKVRQQTQRKATQARTDGTQAMRPIEITEEDLDQQESASLTLICQKIAGLLRKTVQKGQDGVEAEVGELGDDVTPEQLRSIMRKHTISDDGGVPLFDFCVNPRSFGQTVENFFYVSFLIKEGKVGLGFDSNEMPTLQMADPKTVEERQERPRNQAVFALDFETWEDLIESCGIKRSVIPHRNEQDWDDGTLPRGDPTSQINGGIMEDPDMYGPG